MSFLMRFIFLCHSRKSVRTTVNLTLVVSKHKLMKNAVFASYQHHFRVRFRLLIVAFCRVKFSTVKLHTDVIWFESLSLLSCNSLKKKSSIQLFLLRQLHEKFNRNLILFLIHDFNFFILIKNKYVYKSFPHAYTFTQNMLRHFLNIHTHITL